MTAQPIAGDNFRCVCCLTAAPTAEATYDSQYDGPVCDECKRNSLWATAYLRKARITRPFVQQDIKQDNIKRFIT